MDKKAEAKKEGSDNLSKTDELLCRACDLEGCDGGMPCYGVDAKKLCVAAKARYNELRKKELLEEASE